MEQVCEHCALPLVRRSNEKINHFRKRRMCSLACTGAAYHKRAMDDVPRRFMRYVKPVPSGCSEWTGHQDKSGYGRITIARVSKLAHRVAFELNGGIVPHGMVVCHTCDNRLCVLPEHLFLGSPGDNNRDRDRKGRQAKGEMFSHSKLTESDVCQIRQWGDTAASAARHFGVSETTIRKIQYRKSWRHVPDYSAAIIRPSLPE